MAMQSGILDPSILGILEQMQGAVDGNHPATYAGAMPEGNSGVPFGGSMIDQLNGTPIPSALSTADDVYEDGSSLMTGQPGFVDIGNPPLGGGNAWSQPLPPAPYADERPGIMAQINTTGTGSVGGRGFMARDASEDVKDRTMAVPMRSNLPAMLKAMAVAGSQNSSQRQTAPRSALPVQRPAPAPVQRTFTSAPAARQTAPRTTTTKSTRGTAGKLTTRARSS